MSTNKWIDGICVLVAVLALVITGLFMNGEKLGLTTVVDMDAEKNSDSVDFTENDLDGDWSTTSATTIELNGESATVKGQGAYANGSEIVINNDGKYVISGKLSEGKITVDADSEAKIWIQLNGVDIYCSDDACIRVDNADKVFLTLAENSENVLESGAEYSMDALEDNTDGVIFSHEDLTINGSGSLTVTGTYKYGIAANDDLVITGGTIQAEGPNAGIHVNDSFRLTEAELVLTSEGDAIHTGSDFLMKDGTVTISCGDDGIHSDTNLTVKGGTLTIEKCYEGLEAEQVTIEDGVITIYPTDDGINATGETGSMGMPQGNDQNASEGQGDQQTPPQGQDGSVSEPPQGQDGSVSEPPEGFDGNMSEPPEGFDGSMGQPPQESVKAADDNSEKKSDDELPTVTISGGTITIVNSEATDADGIDSNGDIIIEGGEVYISLTGNGSNCALDYGSESGGECRIDGGTVYAFGSSTMIEEMSESSSQVSILDSSLRAEAGSTFTITDANGTVIAQYEVPCSYSCVIFSCPELQLGGTYYLNGASEGITIDSVNQTNGNTGAGFGGMQPPSGQTGDSL